MNLKGIRKIKLTISVDFIYKFYVVQILNKARQFDMNDNGEIENAFEGAHCRKSYKIAEFCSGEETFRVNSIEVEMKNAIKIVS